MQEDPHLLSYSWTHLRTVGFPSLQLEGPGALNLQSPQRRILLPADIFCPSFPGTGRQEESTTCHRYFTDQHDAKQGPVGLLDTEAFLSPIPHRQDSSLHEFLLIPKGRTIANQRRSSNETTWGIGSSTPGYGPPRSLYRP